MPTPSTPYPPAPPTISGQNITVSVFLNNPARVEKTLQNLASNRFIADKIFSSGPAADAGAVVHDQLVEQNLYTSRDVQEIKPGSEFPIVDDAEPNPLVAYVHKWGGSALVTYEAKRRNRQDIVRKKIIKLRNTIVRKVDTVAIATLDAAPIQTQSASGDWTTAATDIISDVETAKSKLDLIDMGYEAGIVLINPLQALDIRKDADIRAAFPRENLSQNLLNKGASDLAGILGLSWYVTNRVAAGTIYVLDSDQTGFISDEIPGPYSRVIDEESKERYRIMAARVPAMGVTDPKSVVKITGA